MDLFKNFPTINQILQDIVTLPNMYTLCSIHIIKHDEVYLPGYTKVGTLVDYPPFSIDTCIANQRYLYDIIAVKQYLQLSSVQLTIGTEVGIIVPYKFNTLVICLQNNQCT